MTWKKECSLLFVALNILFSSIQRNERKHLMSDTFTDFLFAVGCVLVWVQVCMSVCLSVCKAGSAGSALCVTVCLKGELHIFITLLVTLFFSRFYM